MICYVHKRRHFRRILIFIYIALAKSKMTFLVMNLLRRSPRLIHCRAWLEKYLNEQNDLWIATRLASHYRLLVTEDL